MKSFWDNYYKKPLDQIPWQHTQSDWFKKLVDKGKLSGSSALDLGCGTGMKSIYLAKHGFQKVFGIDISPKAIEYAKRNAEKEDVMNTCNFQIGDVGDAQWGFLEEKKKFDVIVDWAAIHCLSREQLKPYTKYIEQSCKKGGFYLVRFFSCQTNKISFREDVDGEATEILLLTKEEIENMLPNFKTIEKNISYPSASKKDAGYHFIELLMERL